MAHAHGRGSIYSLRIFFFLSSSLLGRAVSQVFSFLMMDFRSSAWPGASGMEMGWGAGEGATTLWLRPAAPWVRAGSAGGMRPPPALPGDCDSWPPPSGDGDGDGGDMTEKLRLGGERIVID